MKDYFLYILFLFVGNLSIAQSPYAVQYNESNGLPSNSVYAVFQDSKGFVWASGDEGLAKFDGKKWQTFKAENQSQLSGSNIQEDQYGRIWYENFDGHLFYVFANKMYALKQNAPLNFYNYGITKKHLFVIQRNGIDVFDLKSLKYKKIILKNQYDVNSSFCDGFNFYIITENEILKINEDLNITKTTFINDNKWIFPSLYGANNSLIAKELTVDKVQVLQFSSNLKQYQKIELPIEGNLNGLKFYDNQYWVLSSNGLYLFDHLSSTSPTIYFKGKSISSGIKDRQGNFWIATTNEGLFLLPNMQNLAFDWSKYNPTQIEKVKDKILLSNSKGAIFQFDVNLNFERKLYEHISKAEVYYFEYDAVYNDLYFSSLGFTHIPKMQFQSPVQYEFATKKIERIDAKYAFIGTSTSFGIIKFSDKGNSKWDSVYEKYSIESNGIIKSIQNGVRVRTLAYLKKSEKVFCANSLGFFCFDKENGLQEIKHNGSSFFVKNLYEYNEKVYVLSAQSELFTIANNNLLVNISKSFSELGNSILKIKGFQNKLIVIGVEKVILFDCNTSQITPVNVPVFTKEIRDVLFFNNELLFLTNDKIIKINDYRNIKKESAVFRISDFLIDGKSFLLNKLVNLKNGQHTINIEFSVLDFGTIKDNDLFYRLNRKDWIKLDENRSELQLIINDGKYEIEFKLNNVIQKNKISIAIEVPFWKRWEYSILFSLLFIGLIYMYSHVKLKKLRNKNMILRERNKLLEEKIILEKNLKKSILTTVKSQMNPHFFYNALNTIQAYIFNNDKTKASNYLSKFSKLTRLILEMSEQETVLLKDEIQSLKLYLDLEKMRFQEEFEYQLFYTDDLLFSVELPSMLIQPYLENAVKHGLLHKKEGVGKIDMYFEVIEKDLVVKIIDNGIGIKRSTEINKIRQDKSKSFATSANKKRLDILNDGRTDKISIAFTELTNQNLQVTGTEVKLVIPLGYDL